MDTKEQIQYILAKIAEQAEEISNQTSELSAEEIVIASIEIVLNSNVTNIGYTSPLGQVDRDRVAIHLDDDLEPFPLFGEHYYGEDD